MPQICRLCLKRNKNQFKEVDELVKRVLDVLLLKLDLNLTRDPIICWDCIETAKQCLKFKSTCISTEKNILSFSTNKKMANQGVNVDDDVKDMKDVKIIGDEELDVCRFCMTQLKIKDSVSLMTSMNETVLEMIAKYTPEIDFDVIENPIMCTTCKETLEVYFKFVLKCLHIEDNINEYCRKGRTDSICQVKLDTPRCLFGDILACAVKEKSNTLEGTECAYNITVEEIETLFRGDDLEAKWNHSFDVQINKTIVHDDETQQRKNIKEDSVTTNSALIKMYNCTLCPYESKQMSNLTRHAMLVHKNISEIKMYKCPLCTYQAKQKTTLERHMLVHKDASEVEIYKCLFCSYEAKRKHNMESHMFVHKDVSEIDMYKCSLCAYKSKQRRDLKKHMVVHMDSREIKMYKCPLCNYQTKQNTYLKLHMVVHKDVSEIKMHKCSLCPYEGKQKHYLKRHMLVHKNCLEVKMFKCSLCSYETKHNNSLKLHMVVHKKVSEIEMHKCPLCTYEARRKGNLNRHIKSIHTGITNTKMYKCSLCTYEAKRKGSLKTHMLSHKDVLEMKK